MVTLLLILIMVCNLWILFYLTWEHKEARKADNRKDAWNAHQRPPDDMMGKSRFSMPETKPQATKCGHGKAKRGGGREGRYLC